MHKSRFISHHHLALFSLLSHLSACAIITVPPVPVTVPPFTTTTFTCEGNGDILNWLVQSSVLTDSIAQQRQITVTTTNTSNTNFSSVLTVNVLPYNDNLVIACEFITLNPFNRVISGSALTIRGVSPVEDLQYNFTSNNLLLITWSPPVYYSNDVPIGSPVSYQVLVTDEDGDVILDANTPNTNIEVANITECDTFNISVTALVYQYTSINNTVSNNGSFGYEVVNIAINKDNFKTPNVTIELSCPPSKSNTFLTITIGSEVIQYPITGTDKVVNVIRTLVPSNEYNYTVRVFSLRNKLQYETYTIISTYQVIGFDTNSTSRNGLVDMQCEFVPGATADGCHVTFNGTINGTNITRSTKSKAIELPAGSYEASVYDIVDHHFRGPALRKELYVILSTSTSSIITSESTTTTTATTQSTVSNTVSSTVTETPGTETETSPTSRTTNDANNVGAIVAGILGGTVSVIVLVVLIIFAVCVGITVTKRKRMKVQVFLRSDIATIQQPQAETNQYQDVHELINEAPIATSSVQLTYSRPTDEENPYHVTRSEFLPDYHTIPSHNVEDQLRLQWEQRPSLTSTATQETTLEDSISSTSNDSIHDNAYTTDLNPNDTITAAVNDNTTAAFPDIEATNNTAATITTVNDTAAAMTTVNDTAATPTYAVVAKRTDTTVPPIVLPTADQRVVYDKVNRDINKRGGGVTVYPSNDISAIPPPPSYAATIAQESATVSSPQFKVPVQVTDDAAVVHEQYGNE